MNATASTVAWALHDLGLATSFGGALFGRAALEPAAREIHDLRERREVRHGAWKRFSVANLIAHGLFATTWFIGRGMLSGRAIDRRTRAMVAVKDALIVSSLVTGVTSVAAGMRAQETDSPAAERVSKASGLANLVSLAGVLALSAALAMKSSKSTRFSALARFLP